MGREIPKLRVLTKEELLNVRNGDILYDHTVTLGYHRVFPGSRLDD